MYTSIYNYLQFTLFAMGGGGGGGFVRWLFTNLLTYVYMNTL